MNADTTLFGLGQRGEKANNDYVPLLHGVHEVGKRMTVQPTLLGTLCSC